MECRSRETRINDSSTPARSLLPVLVFTEQIEWLRLLKKNLKDFHPLIIVVFEEQGVRRGARDSPLTRHSEWVQMLGKAKQQILPKASLAANQHSRFSER